MVYFFAMKAAFYIACSFLFLSCGDQSPTPTVAEDTLVQRDTMPAPAASQNPYVPVDLSPMDVSYFPPDYPVAKMSGKVNGLPLARVIYSRPHRQGRKIFGQLLKWGEPWRLGANEATEIEFFRPATVQGKKIAAGRYSLYCIPAEKTWTVCFNTNLYSWGLKRDTTKDVHRFEIPVTAVAQPIEYFTLLFQKTATGADMVMAWDEVETRLPILF
jgi:hypothetical protein